MLSDLYRTKQTFDSNPYLVNPDKLVFSSGLFFSELCMVLYFQIVFTMYSSM